MRVDEKTKIAVNLIVARQQMTTGVNVNTSDGLWKFIEHNAPDIAKEAERLYAEQQQRKGRK